MAVSRERQNRDGNDRRRAKCGPAAPRAWLDIPLSVHRLRPATPRAWLCHTRMPVRIENTDHVYGSQLETRVDTRSGAMIAFSDY